MADSVKDVKISKIQTSDGEQHEINAKYWGGLETTDFYDLKDYVDQIVSGGIKFRGVFMEKPVVVCDEETNQYITYSDEENDIIWHVGDVIIVTEYNEELGEPTKEYILTADGDGNPKWVELGDVSATDQRLTNEIKKVTDAISNKADKSDIPTKTSQLTNDSNYADKTYVDNSLVIVKGDKDNSAVLKGEYEGYSNKAISQVSVAVGAASTSGLKGWYYDAITFDDTNKVYKIYIKYQNKLANGTGLTTTNNTTTQPKLISTSSGSTNSSFKSGYAVGDVISLVNDKKYEDCSTITAINGNVLTVDKLPFTKEDMKTSSMASVIGYEAPDEFSIYCIKREFDDNTNLLTLSKYDKGDVDFGGGSLSEGVQTYAVNIGAHAEGAQTVAKGQYSHAEGIRTIANYASHAEGRDTTAMGSSSHAEGRQTQAMGSSSHAEGDSTTASGSQAHSEGQNTIASGNHSHAEGYNTNAINNQAHAEGGSTTASGKQSHAEGWSTTAAGDHSHAEGGYCQALKKQSHAGGNNSIADGTRSFAHGNYVITTKADEVAFGKYNVSDSDTLFSIGNGSDEDNRFNAFEVTSSGAFINNEHILTNEGFISIKEEYFYPIEAQVEKNTEDITKISEKILIEKYDETNRASGLVNIGEGYSSSSYHDLTNKALGNNSISFGDCGIAVGSSAIAMGSSDNHNYTGTDYDNDWKSAREITDVLVGSTTQNGILIAKGNQSVALGRSCLASGSQSTAIGMVNAAFGAHSVALGGYCIANGKDSAAIGYGCITHPDVARGGFACGKFNLPNSDTLFSVGNGSGVSKRNNALEIKTNGKHYIYGVGGYDGTNPNNTNDVATVLSNISKDIDDIKQSNMDDIDELKKTVLLLQSIINEITVTK